VVWQFDDEIEGVESDPVAGMTNARQENDREGQERRRVASVVHQKEVWMCHAASMP
jgi:hypothetical protein